MGSGWAIAISLDRQLYRLPTEAAGLEHRPCVVGPHVAPEARAEGVARCVRRALLTLGRVAGDTQVVHVEPYALPRSVITRLTSSISGSRHPFARGPCRDLCRAPDHLRLSSR